LEEKKIHATREKEREDDQWRKDKLKIKQEELERRGRLDEQVLAKLAIGNNIQEIMELRKMIHAERMADNKCDDD